MYAADEDSQGPTRLHAADENGKGPAYTEPPEDDPNYSLMGEFVGEINAGEEGEKKLIGLQIRPVGNNEFDALSFLGGLPGQDGHQGEPVRMIGRRSDDFVILSGGPLAIIVESDGCLLLDRKGNRVGRMKRIERTSPTLVPCRRKMPSSYLTARTLTSSPMAR